MMTGYQCMPRIVDTALPEVRQHLWTVYWLARMAAPNPCVELGVRSGESTRAILAGCKDAGNVLVSYDIAGDSYNVREVTEARGLPHFGELWQCVQADSVEAANRVGITQFGLVFIDTDHSLATTTREIAAWHGKVRVGGCIALHDVGLDEPGRDGVGPAARAFVQLSRGAW